MIGDLGDAATYGVILFIILGGLGIGLIVKGAIIDILEKLGVL